MSKLNSEELNKAIAESEIGNGGVGHSKAEVNGGTVVPPGTSSELEMLRAKNAQLEAQLAKTTAPSDNSVNILAAALEKAITKVTAPQVVGPQENDNINRTNNFLQRATIDGNSLIEAQATQQMFKDEVTVPVSIPKTFQNQFGPYLSVSVNGARVAVPCDGKTYFINKTHAEAIRERIAKVDKLLSKTEPEVIEITA